jgi:hypothetical protein
MPAFAGMTFSWRRTYETDISTARRQYVCGSFRRITWNNNVFPRAKLAR